MKLPAKGPRGATRHLGGAFRRSGVRFLAYALYGHHRTACSLDWSNAEELDTPHQTTTSQGWRL